MDQTNTQGGQDLQSLQPQASQTQQTASGFQPGSGSGLTGTNAADSLNQGISSGNLSVAVAGSNSQTSIPPVTNQPVQNNTSSPVFFVAVLLLFIVVVLVAAYRRTRRLNTVGAGPYTEELGEETTWITRAKDKRKKRKKPKKAHHH